MEVYEVNQLGKSKYRYSTFPMVSICQYGDSNIIVLYNSDMLQKLCICLFFKNYI